MFISALGELNSWGEKHTTVIDEGQNGRRLSSCRNVTGKPRCRVELKRVAWGERD